MAEIQRVQRGQRLRIPIRAYNAFADATRDIQKLRQTGGVGGDVKLPLQATIVHVKNASGFDCARHDVLGIDGPVFEPEAPAATNHPGLDSFRNEVILKGVIPKVLDDIWASHVGRFFILREPAAKNVVVTAWLAGVCPCKVMITDATHKYADVKHNDRGHLLSGERGSARILWRDTHGGETGLHWAVVALGIVPDFPVGQIQHQVYGNVTQNEMGHGLNLGVPDLVPVVT